MRQLDEMAKNVGQGIERDAKKNAGKDQKQRRGEIPHEREHACKEHDTDAADGYGPGQIFPSLQMIVGRACHAESSQN